MAKSIGPPFPHAHQHPIPPLCTFDLELVSFLLLEVTPMGTQSW